MGSETLALMRPKSPLRRDLVSRRRPMQRITSIAMRAPATRPGKKPARMAVAGKALQCSWGIEVWVMAELEAVVLGTVVAMSGAFVDVVEALLDAEDEAGVAEGEPF